VAPSLAPRPDAIPPWARNRVGLLHTSVGRVGGLGFLVEVEPGRLKTEVSRLGGFITELYWLDRFFDNPETGK
jgi:hypothetical protein